MNELHSTATSFKSIDISEIFTKNIDCKVHLKASSKYVNLISTKSFRKIYQKMLIEF